MQNIIYGLGRCIITAIMMLISVSGVCASDNEAPLFIVIGQSNADGSAIFDSAIDSVMQQWYVSDSNPHTMKIWYRSCEVENQASNALGEQARWCVDGKVTDVEPGWLDLWYRNENTLGRTAMNMVHSYGTYSTGDSSDCAQGRRGMEGQFGLRFIEKFPDKELYIIKLGVSGSHISSWSNEADDTNWQYFFDNMFKPAVESLLAAGRRPVLTGIWWMQGCADKNREPSYYEECLRKLVKRCEDELGFPDAKFYIGQIVKPGESVDADAPLASLGYGEGVRQAQMAVAADMPNVELVDSRNFLMQYEQAFKGYIHFNHKGVNAIGDELARRVAESAPDGWSEFVTPGHWVESDGMATFVPTVGHPEITYRCNGHEVEATLSYPGFTETQEYLLPLKSTLRKTPSGEQDTCQ